MTTTPRPAYIWDANSNDWAPLAGTVDTGQSYNFSAVQNFNAGVSSTSYNGGSIIGRNKIINGDFGIWQRGTSFSNVSGYSADRWQFSWSGTSTSNITRQDLPIGAIPGGNESSYFARYTRTTTVGDDYFLQRVEDVRTLLGKTVTFSFWAKANVATTISQVYGATVYGSGGSSGSGFGNFSGIAIGTTWSRYSFTATVESGVGKTVGTSSFTELVFKFATSMGNIVVDIWGVQLEIGSQATLFHTATANQQTELAACQRYYEKSYPLLTTPGTATQTGMINIQNPSASTGNIRGAAPFNVTKRVAATIALYDGAGTVNRVMYDYTNNKTGTAVGTEKWADVYSDGTTNKFALSFHYTADAEL
jgi:hypothetical protein